MDSDHDGEISCEKLNVTVFTPELFETFRPLLEELAELDDSLDLEEFIDAAGRLYDSLNQHQKNLILRFGKSTLDEKDYNNEECTFKPKINSAIRPSSKAQVINRPQNATDLRRAATSSKKVELNKSVITNT